MITGAMLVNSMRYALDDEGDPSQDSSGNPAPAYFWSTPELVIFLNMALEELYEQLIKLGRINELKNMVRKFTTTTLPTDYYTGIAARINSEAAVLRDDPTDLSAAAQTIQYAVTVVGTQVYVNPSTFSTVEIRYYRMPAAIANNSSAMTELTEEFYATLVPLAIFFACHKDNAEARLVLRRTFGTENQQLFPVQRYLENIR